MGMDLQLARKINDDTKQEHFWGKTYTYYTGFEEAYIGSWNGTRWASIKDVWTWFFRIQLVSYMVNEAVDYCRPKDLAEARRVLDELVAETNEGDKTQCYELLDILEKNPDVYVSFLN